MTVKAEPPESLRRRGIRAVHEALDQGQDVRLPAKALTTHFGQALCAWLEQRKAPPVKRRRYLRRTL